MHKFNVSSCNLLLLLLMVLSWGDFLVFGSSPHAVMASIGPGGKYPSIFLIEFVQACVFKRESEHI